MQRREFLIKSTIAGLSLLVSPSFAQDINTSKYYNGKQTIENPPGAFRVNRMGESSLVMVPTTTELEGIHNICEEVKKDLVGIVQDLSTKGDEGKLFANAAQKTADSMYFFMTRNIPDWRTKKIASVMKLSYPIQLEIMGQEGFKKVTDSLSISPMKSPGTHTFTFAQYPWLKDVFVYGLPRYEGMKEGMKNFGITISANVFEDNRQLHASDWKQLVVDTSPKKGYVISSGTFRGCIVLENGDLYVPGMKFYQRVLKGDISSYDRLRYHFTDGIPDMKEALKRKDYPGAIKTAVDLLENDRFRSFAQAQILFQAGETFYEASKIIKDGRVAEVEPDSFNKAISAYEDALKVFPGMHEAHFSLFQRYYQLNQKDKALVSLNLAITFAPTEVADQYRKIKGFNYK